MLLIVAILSGFILGGILWAIDHFTQFYLVLLFPLIAGSIAGGALRLTVSSAKVRNAVVAFFCGIIAGLIMFAVYHFATYYVSFRGEVRDALAEQGTPAADDAELDTLINEVLQSDYKDSGFTGYLRYAADQGINITNFGPSSSSSSPMELKGDIMWGYWVVEILIAAGMAAFVAVRATREPFDENANEWYNPAVEAFALADKKSKKALLNALKEGAFSEAGSLLTREELKYPRFEVHLRRSPDPASQDILLSVQQAQRKGQLAEIKRGLVSPAELDMMEKALQARPPALSQK
jgi:hypothetical protein